MVNTKFPSVKEHRGRIQRNMFYNRGGLAPSALLFRLASPLEDRSTDGNGRVQRAFRAPDRSTNVAQSDVRRRVGAASLAGGAPRRSPRDGGRRWDVHVN